MSFWTTLIGAGGAGIAKPIDSLGKIFDDMYTTEGETLDKETALARVLQHPDIMQIELNKVEIQHRSILVAGWRPAIGWVCAIALGYQFVVRDLLGWALNVLASFLDVAILAPPSLDLTQLMAILTTMLGFGGFRTYEKIRGATK